MAVRKRKRDVERERLVKADTSLDKNLLVGLDLSHRDDPLNNYHHDKIVAMKRVHCL